MLVCKLCVVFLNCAHHNIICFGRFNVLQRNDWNTIDRHYETFESDNVCKNDHDGQCTGSHCVSWDNQVQCQVHEHGVDCGNRPFGSLGARIGIYNVSDAEFGVFAKDQIQKGMFVIEYLGVVTSNKEVGSGKVYYVMLDGDLLLDGATNGSLASFVNHSCTPNCSLQIWMVPVSAGKYEPRVGIFSLELIGKGVPLTIDYRMMSIVQFNMQCLC